MTINSSNVKLLSLLRKNYMNTPHTVSIETYSLCNGRCDFCPYSDLERIGEKMDTATVYRLIDEIAKFPGKQPVIINLSRVNEPFLDSRIFDFSKYINEHVPFARLVYFTNGSVFSSEIIKKMSQIKNINFLNVSFNDHRKNEYEKTMGLSFKNIQKKLNLLHEAISDGVLSFPIRLSRVGDGTHVDNDFLQWVKEHYPSFKASVSPRGNWIGSKPISPQFLIPDVGCSQWFKLHVLSNGNIAFCCIDAHGLYGKGNINRQSLLEIYNDPRLTTIRQNINSRYEIQQCSSCPLNA